MKKTRYITFTIISYISILGLLSGQSFEGIYSGTFWGVSGFFGENGGKGTISTGGYFSVTDVEGTVYTGIVSDRHFNIEGNFSGGSENGSLSLSRTIDFTHYSDPQLPSPEIRELGSSSFELIFDSKERRSYSVYRSEDLIDWDYLMTLRGSGTDLFFTDNTSKRRYFYRLVVEK